MEPLTDDENYVATSNQISMAYGGDMLSVWKKLNTVLFKIIL